MPTWSRLSAPLMPGSRSERAARTRVRPAGGIPAVDQRMRAHGLAIGPGMPARAPAGRSGSASRPARTSHRAAERRAEQERAAAPNLRGSPPRSPRSARCRPAPSGVRPRPAKSRPRFIGMAARSSAKPACISAEIDARVGPCARDRAGQIAGFSSAQYSQIASDSQTRLPSCSRIRHEPVRRDRGGSPRVGAGAARAGSRPPPRPARPAAPRASRASTRRNSGGSPMTSRPSAMVPTLLLDAADDATLADRAAKRDSPPASEDSHERDHQPPPEQPRRLLDAVHGQPRNSRPSPRLLARAEGMHYYTTGRPRDPRRHGRPLVRQRRPRAARDHRGDPAPGRA